jgi:hypothetical protein
VVFFVEVVCRVMSGRKKSYTLARRTGSTIYYLSRQTGSSTDSCHGHEIGGKNATHGSGDLFGVVDRVEFQRRKPGVKIHLLTKTALWRRT